MPRVVPAVIRALDILELFLDRPLLSAREIGERLGLPRTTVHELLVTLVARSYLISEPGQPVRYRLGMPLFQLGASFAGQDVRAVGTFGAMDVMGMSSVVSYGIVVALGRTDADAQRRAAPLHVKSVLPPEDPVEGSPAQLVQRIEEMRAIGATRVHLRLIEMDDLDHVDLIASEVLPQLSR